MKAYPVGWPLWQAAGKSGLPLSIRVKVTHDTEAGVYVAAQSNLPGLVAEAETLEDLLRNIEAAAADLIQEHLQATIPRSPAVTFDFCPA